MTNEQLGDLQDRLNSEVSKWHLPPNVLADEIVSESISALWESERKGVAIKAPSRWLLGTAQKKKLEISRRNRRYVQADKHTFDKIAAPNSEKHSVAATPCAFDSQSVYFENSQAWQAINCQQRRVLIQNIMWGEPIGEVAREYGVNRATASSWVRRNLQRLRLDEYLLSLAGGGCE